MILWFWCLFAAQHILLSSTQKVSANPGSWQMPRIRGMTMNIARSFNNWRKYRQTVNELDRMSNRELHDLGIDRADIRRIARQAANF